MPKFRVLRPPPAPSHPPCPEGCGVGRRARAFLVAVLCPLVLTTCCCHRWFCCCLSCLLCRWDYFSPQDRSLHSLAQKFENQIFAAAMNVEDYTSRINKKLTKVQKVRVWSGFDIFIGVGWTGGLGVFFYVNVGVVSQGPLTFCLQ